VSKADERENETYKAVHSGLLVPDGVAAEALRPLLDISIERNPEAFLEGVDGLGAIFNLAGELEYFLVLLGDFSRVLFVGILGFHF
jgi:hypothetical protein